MTFEATANILSKNTSTGPTISVIGTVSSGKLSLSTVPPINVLLIK